MRGGKWQGAGRKPSEPTKVIRVPESMIPEIMAFIFQRRQSDGLVTEIKPLKHVTEIETLEAVTEIKLAPLKDSQEIKEASKALQGLNSRTCKVLRKAFGTLTKAAELGVRAKPDGGIWVPDAIQHRLVPFM